MVRRSAGLVALAVCGAVAAGAQPAPSIEAFFTGKTVTPKIDMPGTEKGVDLDFSSAAPMNYKTYNSRLTDFGVAIHQGETAQVTKIALKKDHIEFQLNGGGYGTFGENTETKVNAKDVDKSAYEKDLEKQLKATKDPKQHEQIQESLDKEVAKRERADADAKAAAAAATQQKEAALLDKRAHGGSRFNLNFKGTIPNDDKNPDAVMKLLADYVDFNAAPAVVNGYAVPDAGTPGRQPLPGAAPASATGQLKQGMKLSDVASLLGQGNVVSQSNSADGLATQTMEYQTTENVVDATFVQGVMVRYTISSK